MYITVKVAWIVFITAVALVVLCAWRFPRTVVPLTLGIAAAGALALILHL
jgi:hypothetical protein